MASMFTDEGLRGTASHYYRPRQRRSSLRHPRKRVHRRCKLLVVQSLGHCNPKINEAIKNQLDKLEHVIFANFSHKPAIELCQQLMEIIPKGLCKFNFSDNGSAAVECALKMAFQYQYQSGKAEKQNSCALQRVITVRQSALYQWEAWICTPKSTVQCL